MPISTLDLLLLCLATWRLAYMLTQETGPFAIFTRLRKRFPLGGVTTCIYCMSVWTALLGYIVLQSPFAWLVWIMAASGGAMMLWRQTGGNHV